MCWSKSKRDLGGSGAGFLKNTLWIVECVGQRLREICGAVGVGQAVASQVGASCSLVSSIFPALQQSTGGTENFDDPNTDIKF